MPLSCVVYGTVYSTLLSCSLTTKVASELRQYRTSGLRDQKHRICVTSPFSNTSQYNESTEVQTHGVNSHTAIYSINILSKYSSLISHGPFMFEGRHNDYRSSRSTHQTPIFEGRHIDHRSSKVNTSISEGRHIDLRKSTHRSPKVDTS